MAAGRRESAGTDLVLFETLTEVTAELLDIQPLRSAVEAILTWEPTRKPRVVKTPSLEALNASKLLSRSGADYCSALVELDRDEDGGRFIWVVKSRYSVSVSGRLSFEMSGTELSWFETTGPVPWPERPSRPQRRRHKQSCQFKQRRARRRCGASRPRLPRRGPRSGVASS